MTRNTAGFAKNGQASLRGPGRAVAKARRVSTNKTPVPLTADIELLEEAQAASKTVLDVAKAVLAAAEQEADAAEAARQMAKTALLAAKTETNAAAADKDVMKMAQKMTLELEAADAAVEATKKAVQTLKAVELASHKHLEAWSAVCKEIEEKYACKAVSSAPMSGLRRSKRKCRSHT